MERKDTIIHAKSDHSIGDTNTLGLRPLVLWGEQVDHKITLSGTAEEIAMIKDGLEALDDDITTRGEVCEGVRLIAVRKLLGEISTSSSVDHKAVPDDRSILDMLEDAEALAEYIDANNPDKTSE